MENNIDIVELQKHTELLDGALLAGLSEIKNTSKNHDLDQVKSKYLGKGSSMSSVMSTLRNASPELKKQIGELTNKFKNKLENAIQTQREQILEKELSDKLALETIDVTVSGNGNNLGGFHPVSLSENRMIEIFRGLGFEVADGPEVETDYYNFEALNIPKNHPARAMQDTFYTETGHVLRTHTSPIQIRYAEKNTPPIKVIAPGRVYRIDMDATHSPMFHQLEGLWIDKNISFANLKGVIIEFLKRFFENENLETRFRASFFPFTEPSAEVDIMSKNGKWLEVAGCGMVHPNVLQAMNIDTSIYSGFAFGIGIDRFTMLKYGINDLRLMFENNLDFLNQFQVCH